MHPYQRDIQHAAQVLIDGIFFEEEELARLTAEHHALEAELNRMADVVDFCRLNPDLDDDGIGTSVFWEAHFDVSPREEDARNRVEGIAKSIEARRASADALACGLLQVVKQGMSLVNGGLSQSPEGRRVGTQKLRAVVWQARNQSMHFEEQQLNEWVVRCFETLGDEVSPVFKLYSQRSLAYEVVKVLGWEQLPTFNNDLASMLP